MITKVTSGYFISVYYALMMSVLCILKISHKLNDYKSDIRLCNKYLCTHDISTVYLKAIFAYDYKSDIGLLYKCVCTNNMGLDARKPVFGGLRTTQAQTSLRIRAD